MDVLRSSYAELPVSEIHRRVEEKLGPTPESSIRSYLRLNRDGTFSSPKRGRYLLSEPPGAYHTTPLLPPTTEFPSFSTHGCTVFHGDCFDWLRSQSANSIHAIVTDPPYGLVEFSEKEKAKLRNGRGGVWRIPPSFDGHERSPLPRFTTLTAADLADLADFFFEWGRAVLRVIVPGANVVVASNPLVSHLVSKALADAGLERRGELIRLVMTMRGGDRPKSAHEEFSEVSVMPRSMWEPWLLFRKPVEGRVQDNLRTWGTGGFRRPAPDKPFPDVVKSAPTRSSERALAPHPSLKPQGFLRFLVRGVLPLGKGVVVDPFAGSGSTLAAAANVGYTAVGVERDAEFFETARKSIPALAELKVSSPGS